MKKFSALLLFASLLGSILVACSGSGSSASQAQTSTESVGASTNDGEKIVVAFAADQGGINDKAVNEGTYLGMERAEKEFGFDLKVVESRSHDDYEPTLETFISAKAKLIVGVGSQMTEAMRLVAERNPDIHFVSMDAVSDAPNVKSFVFKENEGSFLVGVVAGLTTKTNKIGFIGGKDVEVINRFETGFIAGVMSVNPEAGEYLRGSGGASGAGVKFVDSFSDSNKAYELAKSLYSAGCDVIYHAAGGAGIGMLQATKDVNESGQKVWAIGVDQDQAVVLPEYGDYILTSMVKKTGDVVYATIKEELDGKFEPGVFVVGLADGAVGLAESGSVNTPPDVLALAVIAEQMVRDGKITVPQTRAELEVFVPVEVK